MEEYLELQRLVYRVSEGVREEGRKDLPGLAGKRATSENPLSQKFREQLSLLKNPTRARSWPNRLAIEAPDRASESRNRRFGTRIEDRKQQRGVFQQAELFHALG
jgi:hypothetical protein